MVRFDIYFDLYVSTRCCCVRLTTLFVLRFKCFTWLASNGKMQQPSDEFGGIAIALFRFGSPFTVALTSSTIVFHAWWSNFHLTTCGVYGVPTYTSAVSISFSAYLTSVDSITTIDRSIVANVNDNRRPTGHTVFSVQSEGAQQNDFRLFLSFKFEQMVCHFFASYFSFIIFIRRCGRSFEETELAAKRWIQFHPDSNELLLFSLKPHCRLADEIFSYGCDWVLRAGNTDDRALETRNQRNDEVKNKIESVQQFYVGQFHDELSFENRQVRIPVDEHSSVWAVPTERRFASICSEDVCSTSIHFHRARWRNVQGQATLVSQFIETSARPRPILVLVSSFWRAAPPVLEVVCENPAVNVSTTCMRWTETRAALVPPGPGRTSNTHS